MSEPPSADGDRRIEAIAYFMIRVRPPADGNPAELTGMIERLGAGEKRSFANAEELLRLLAVWPGTELKLRPLTDVGNG